MLVDVALKVGISRPHETGIDTRVYSQYYLRYSCVRLIDNADVSS